MAVQNGTEINVVGAPLSDQAYAEFVRSRFDEANRVGEAIVFANRGSSHARAVLGQIVSRSQQSLEVFTGCLSAAVYDAALLRSAATRISAKPIRVLIGNSVFDEKSALDHLRQEVSDSLIQVKCVANLFKIKPNLTLDHFAIGDGKHIRAEEDASDRTATVILNADKFTSGDLAKAYSHVFNILWDRSENWSMPDAV